MEPTRSRAEIESELAEARRRLAEAESTLEAIRAGKVDALIITDNRGQEEVRNILNMGSLANSMFNLVTQPIFILDAQNRIQRLNQAAFDLVDPDPIGKYAGRSEAARTSRSRSVSGTTARASYRATTSSRNGTYPGSSMRGGTTATSAA